MLYYQHSQWHRGQEDEIICILWYNTDIKTKHRHANSGLKIDLKELDNEFAVSLEIK